VAAIGAVLVAALVAALLPGATIHLHPSVSPIDPVSYSVTLPAQADAGTLKSDLSGTVTGTYDKSTRARGRVFFANYNSESVAVPQGTQVSGGGIAFTTDQGVVVPRSPRPNQAGIASVGSTAAAPGPEGNVAADAIDTIDDGQVRSGLCPFFFGCPRLVANRDAFSGGTTKTGPQVSQKDVDALVARIKDDLQKKLSAQLATDPDRVYAPPAAAQDPAVTVPAGLVGTKDKPTFSLSGTLRYDRRFVRREQLVDAGRAQLIGDPTARDAGTTIVASSIDVQPGDLRASGSQVAATLSVTASETPQVDLDALKRRIAGMTRAQASTVLASYGTTRIDFWPGWVDAVPRLPFRVDLSLDVDGSAGSSQSSSPAP
jgi:hypothetical protein